MYRGEHYEPKKCKYPNCISILSNRNKSRGYCYFHQKQLLFDELVERDEEKYQNNRKIQQKRRDKEKRKRHEAKKHSSTINTCNVEREEENPSINSPDKRDIESIKQME